MLVSAALVAATSARRIEHPRIAADYPETELGNDATALRFSDRDPVVAYFAANALDLADLSITKVGGPNPVIVGPEPDLHHHRHQQRSGRGRRR